MQILTHLGHIVDHLLQSKSTDFSSLLCIGTEHETPSLRLVFLDNFWQWKDDSKRSLYSVWPALWMDEGSCAGLVEVLIPKLVSFQKSLCKWSVCHNRWIVSGQGEQVLVACGKRDQGINCIFFLAILVSQKESVSLD